MNGEIKTEMSNTYLKEMIGIIGDALPEDGPGRYTAEELILAVTYADAVTNGDIKRSDAFNSILLKPNIEKIARYIIDKAEDGDITPEQTRAMGDIAEIAIKGYHAIGQFIYAEEKGISPENNMDTAMQLLGVKNPVVNDYREKEPSSDEPSDELSGLLVYFETRIVEGNDSETEAPTRKEPVLEDSTGAGDDNGIAEVSGVRAGEPPKADYKDPTGIEGGLETEPPTGAEGPSNPVDSGNRASTHYDLKDGNSIDVPILTGEEYREQILKLQN